MPLTTLDFVLLIPLLAILLLLPAALTRRWQGAGRINNLISILTLSASVALAWEVWQGGPQWSLKKLFFIDAFNIYLILITTFVGYLRLLSTEAGIF